jgi:hypothetical protein
MVHFAKDSKLNILGKGSLDNGYLDNGFSNKYENNLKNKITNLMNMFFYL